MWAQPYSVAHLFAASNFASRSRSSWLADGDRQVTSGLDLEVAMVVEVLCDLWKVTWFAFVSGCKLKLTLLKYQKPRHGLEVNKRHYHHDPQVDHRCPKRDKFKVDFLKYSWPYVLKTGILKTQNETHIKVSDITIHKWTTHMTNVISLR